MVTAEKYQMRMEELKIVIAEDSSVLSNLLKRSLSAIEGFNVVGVARDGVGALELVRELEPHVLVLDISMPFKNGIEVLREIRAKDASTIIIMFTSDASPLTMRLCLDAGANYFLDKSQTTKLIEICNVHLLAPSWEEKDAS